MSTDTPFDLVVSIVLYKPNLPYLEQTLTSLTATSMKIKIAVADNSAEAVAPEFLARFPQVDYSLTGKNLGFGRAHNINIQKFSKLAPYFLVLNPDIYFGPQLLGELTARLDADRSIGLAIPCIRHPSGTMQMVNRRLPRPQDYVMNFVNNKWNKKILSTRQYEKFLLRDVDLEKPFLCPTISGCFMFFRSAVLSSVGGFDQRYFLYLEDTDLSRRVAKDHKTVVFSDLVAYHHWGRGAYHSPRLFLLFVGNLGRYFNKWGWLSDRERDELNGRVGYYSVIPKSGSSVLKKPGLFDSLES